MRTVTPRHLDPARWPGTCHFAHLTREFRAVRDCSRGHLAVHYVTGAFKDQWTGRRRVHRRCAVEGCDSLWSEWAFSEGVG